MLVIVKIIFLKTCYTEKHHIIPKCLNGNNSKENLVIVSTKEHYLLHHLLVKIYPKNRDLKNALFWIKTRLNIEKKNSPYQCIRKCEYSKINTTGYGKTFKHSEETKNKISESKRGKQGFWKGKHLTDIAKQKLSIAHKNKHLTDITKQKLSNVFKGRIWVNNGLIQKQVFPNEIPEGFVRGMLKKVH